MCVNSKLVKSMSMFGQIDVASNCGYCIECYLKKANEWKVRLYYEFLDNPAKYAIILTYEGRGIGSGDALINVKDVQSFNKRMRSRGFSYRFFCSHEYGERKGRRHAHLIFFGMAPDLELKFKEYQDNGFHIYSSKLLKEVWTYGLVRVQLIDGIVGLTKYLNKYYCKESFSPAFYEAVCRKAKIRYYNELDYEDVFVLGRKRDYAYKCALADRYEETELKALKKQLIRSRPRHTFSLSLGYDSWVKRVEDYVLNDGVYIDGYLCKVPLSWIKKYCARAFALDYLYRLSDNGFTLDLNLAQAQLEVARRFFLFRPDKEGECERRYKNAQTYVERLAYYLREANIPAMPYSDVLYADYLKNVSEYDPERIVYESSNRSVKFDVVDFLEKKGKKMF